MYRSAKKILSALATLFVSLLFSAAAAPQTARFANVVYSAVPASNIPPFPLPCTDGQPKPSPNERGERAILTDLVAGCSASGEGNPMADPCKATTLTPPSCAVLVDPIPAELGAMGRQGRKILRARLRVLDILQGVNACTSWYGEKVPDPAAIFRRIDFALDRKGEESVREIHGPDALTLLRSPYVARVVQGEGSSAKITINTNGAFFWASANVLVVDVEGGPSRRHGERWLHVGPYLGDSQDARVVTLLHEFGHAVDLLPTDGNGMDGKSVRNTEEVLRHCRHEVETMSSAKYPAAVR